MNSPGPQDSTGKPVRRVRFRSLKKEAALGFLAGFYFLIATNTQTGWLFLMSAFMLGVLVVSWAGPRRDIRSLAVERTLLGSPQMGVPLPIKVQLHNSGDSVARETHLEQTPQAWSLEESFKWTVPRLEAGQSISTEFTLTPQQRGEHQLTGSRVICGAPFGLFTVFQESEASQPFLIYPKLESLPSRHRRSRLSGVLSEMSSPHQRGDGRTLRSLREYRAGDDLRMVHWKSSAKTGGALLVREHQAPSRQLSMLVLDTSQLSPGVAFEKAVSLTASLLWAAHRAGTRSCLVLLGEEGWSFSKRWQEQFTQLARIQPQEKLNFESWQNQAKQALDTNTLSRTSSSAILVTALSSTCGPRQWPAWPAATVVCLEPNQVDHSGLGATIPVDATRDGFHEVKLGG